MLLCKRLVVGGYDNKDDILLQIALFSFYHVNTHTHKPSYLFLKTHFFLGWCKTWTLDSGLDCGLDYGLRFGLDFGLTRLILTTISNQGSIERRAVNLLLLLEHRVGVVSGVTEMENNRLTSL